MSNNKELTMTALMATIYIVLNAIPISQFIGSAIFIPLSIIFIPVMAWLLTPKNAAIASIIGGLGSLIFNPVGTAGMGVFAILVPFIATTVGSLTIHSNYRYATIVWLVVEFGIYIFRYSGEAPLAWGTHYLIAALLAGYGVMSGKRDPIWYAASIAMSENAVLNVFSMYVVGLPAGVWNFILVPSMIERIIATVGSILIIKAITKTIPQAVPQLEG